MTLLERIFRGSRLRAADALIAQGNRAEAQGLWHEACDLYRKAVDAAPSYAKAQVNLGIALEALGDMAGAVAAQERALANDPADPYANYNLAKLRYEAGAFANAETLLTRALGARPEFPEARVLRACTFSAQGKQQAAIADFKAALRDRPDDFGALFQYGRTLRGLDRLAEAEEALRHALRIEPQNIDARSALADVLSAQGRLDDALAALEAILAQRPAWADALYNYGCLLRKKQRLEEAERAFRGAIEAQSDHARAYQLLGGVLLAQGRTREALELYRRGRHACPQDAGLASAELFGLLCSDEISDAELFSRHKAFGREIEARTTPTVASFRNARDPDRRLRIGYVSADFCYHVVTLTMLPLLEHHDRAACEIYCYSTVERPDAYTRQIEARCDVWRPCTSLSDHALADAIAQDGVDILVDLSGHSGISQLPTMARQPAPVQVTWLGYLNTTGLERIHYRISDAIADPPALTERHHTEALARLPHSQWCYRPFAVVAEAEVPPCARNGYVTFGSFHGAMKLSPTVRRLWTRLLAEVGDARLVVLGVPNGRAQEALISDLGAGAGRITVLPYVSLQDYLRWYGSVDIMLDTTPYSGGITTCDALFMGVPVVTAPGTRSVSRSAASALTTVGLTDWIAADAQDYVRKAAGFAKEPELLAGLRRSLRARMQTSPLMDEKSFAHDLEQAYRRMWRQWCSGGRPQGW